MDGFGITGPSKTYQFWKLDLREGPSRKRLKMLVNLQGGTHSKATRDAAEKSELDRGGGGGKEEGEGEGEREAAVSLTRVLLREAEDGISLLSEDQPGTLGADEQEAGELERRKEKEKSNTSEMYTYTRAPNI